MANFDIESLSDFINKIEILKNQSESSGNYSEFLFRGQRSDQKLCPKLVRLNLNGEIKNIEKLMLNEFKKSSLPLADFEPKDNWDLLALAQHHGLPTRLLDWTYSALVALWFAVHKPPKDNNCGVVWVLSNAINLSLTTLITRFCSSYCTS